MCWKERINAWLRSEPEVHVLIPFSYVSFIYSELGLLKGNEGERVKLPVFYGTLGLSRGSGHLRLPWALKLGGFLANTSLSLI